MPEEAVKVSGLSKRYPGGQQALAGLEMIVPAGSIYVLLGVNGAGKTTLLRILMGFIRADSGRAWVLGSPVTGGWGGGRAAAMRARVGYVPEREALYSWLTVGETLSLGGPSLPLPWR